MTKKRRRVTRYIAQTRLSNAGRPDTLPGEFHDTSALDAAALRELLRLHALTVITDSIPNEPDDESEDTNS